MFSGLLIGSASIGRWSPADTGTTIDTLCDSCTLPTTFNRRVDPENVAAGSASPTFDHIVKHVDRESPVTCCSTISITSSLTRSMCTLNEIASWIFAPLFFGLKSTTVLLKKPTLLNVKITSLGTGALAISVEIVISRLCTRIPDAGTRIPASVGTTSSTSSPAATVCPCLSTILKLDCGQSPVQNPVNLCPVTPLNVSRLDSSGPKKSGSSIVITSRSTRSTSSLKRRVKFDISPALGKPKSN